MDTTWYYIGIIVAVIAIVWALNVLFRKPHFRNHLENSPVEIDEATGQPILPRHLRDEKASHTQTGTAATVDNTATDAVALSANTHDNASDDKADDKPKAEMTAQELLDDWLNAKDQTRPDKGKAEQTAATTSENSESDSKAVASDNANTSSVTTERQDEIVANDVSEDISTTEKANAEKTDAEQSEPVEDAENRTDIFAQHVNEHAQQQQSSLSTAEEMITLYIYPHKPELTNDQLIKLLKNHGLRFGEMACFHRYEYREGQPPVVMFSALKLDENATPTGFDLDDTAEKMVSGLALFIALPHEDAVKAFDMLASTAVIIANEIEGSIFDENFSDFSHEVRNQWREYVISRA